MRGLTNSIGSFGAKIADVNLDLRTSGGFRRNAGDSVGLDCIQGNRSVGMGVFYNKGSGGAPRRPIGRREVIMTHIALRVSAIALGVASLVSLPSPPAVRADEPAPTPSTPGSAPSAAPSSSAAAPSLAEPAPTPDFWVESGSGRPTVAQHPAARRYAHHHARHYGWPNGHRYYSDNPVAAAATGVVGGVADLGSIAAYPFYCFPDYGSCSVHWSYRF